MKILFAEDDKRLGKLTYYMLQKEFSHVDWVDHGEDAYGFASSTSYDVLILDWMMPRLNGIDVCRILRKDGYQGAIIILTAKDALEDKICGLDSGADDYLVKPFQFEELLARIRAVFRRQPKLIEQVINIHNLSLHMESQLLYKHEEIIYLTKKEYQLLELLMRNRKQVLTREQIIDYVWGFDSGISDNALDALVKLVRKKIDDKDQPSFIQNVRGVGYKVSTKYV
jgi:DNA-binding response OmpR family regulator